MATLDMIIQIFGRVDDALQGLPKHLCWLESPSVCIGVVGSSLQLSGTSP
jgi:hypothetical protein